MLFVVVVVPGLSIYVVGVQGDEMNEQSFISTEFPVALVVPVVVSEMPCDIAFPAENVR